MSKRHVIEYHDIAKVQLDAAIVLYEQNNFIPALTLAGAAEHVTGGLFKEIDREPILDSLKRELSVKTNMSEQEVADALNLFRNSFKHFKEVICEQDIEIEEQARVLIMRAVSNYCLLRKQKTDAMDRFIKIFEKRTNNEKP
jgi:hypothetical protein